ncbi:MAG: PCRF domain-containing protein, partial [Actinomycetota bacterium]|nr:PCRF domain-containing protein [Actinomycetota bacterium]
MLERLAKLDDEYEHVLTELSDPDVVTDQRRLRDMSRRHKQLEPVVLAYRELQAATDDGDAAR